MSFSLVGLASGLDTASIINSLIELERLPIKNLESQKSDLAKKQDVLRSINTKLSTLKNLAADLKLASFYKTNKAAVSDGTVLRAAASGSAIAGAYTIEVEQLATPHVMGAGKQKKGEEVSVSDGGIKINNILVSYTVQDANGNQKTWQKFYEDLADAINSKKDIGVRATVIKTDSEHVQLVLTSENGAEIKIENGEALSFEEIRSATNAIIKINGLEVQSTSNKLDNVIPGLTIDLLKTGTVTVEVGRDTDSIVKKIEEFVKAYNDVVSTIRNNTGKEQVLQGDSTLRMLDSRLQSILYNEPPEGALPSGFTFLHQLGLEIDKGMTSGSLMTGTIQFDQETFKEKLAENPDAVIRLLTDDGYGIMSLLDREISTWTSSGNGILTSKINGFSAEITLVDERIERMEERLLRKEEQLKKQFAAMEVALAQLQSQQQWLSMQLNAMTVSMGKKS